ncbi:MAG: hypothetical protein CMJ83_06075 [Planctomycetes bacterium]|nr:hypothetical protein [Planctomycetota bacterium]
MLFALACCAVLPAQTLTVNGSSTSAEVLVPSMMTMVLTATPGLPYFWGINTSPGPTLVYGVPVPVAIDPELILLEAGGPFPSAGTRTWALSIPNAPAIVGATYYSAFAIADPAAPNGLTASNGVSFTFTSMIEAGPDVATFIDEGIGLDGSGNRDPFTGQLPAGTTMQWTVTSAPPGASWNVGNDQSEFPVFSADTPGSYILDLNVAGPGLAGVDSCTVHVYGFSVARVIDGDFATGTVDINGAAVGPEPYLITVNGTPAGGFGSLWFGGPFTPTGPMDTAVIRLTPPTGGPITVTRAITVGDSATLGQPAQEAAGIRLRAAGLNGLEPLIETELAALDFNAAVMGVGTVNAVNGAPGFSANITPLSGTIAPNIDFDMTADNGHVDVSVTFHNVHVDLEVNGVLLFVSYSEGASIDATSATLTGEAVFTPGPGGAVNISFSNPTATLNNFNFTLSNFLNGLLQLGFIQDAIRDLVEDALESLAGEIAGFINPLLADFAFSIDLTPFGIPVQADFPLQSSAYDSDGVTMCNTFSATVLSTGPESPPLTKYLATPSSSLSYPSTTPLGGQPYGFALCLSDDLLNQLLAAFVASGTLDLDLTGSLGEPPNQLDLTAGFMDLLAPNVGFGGFDPLDPVTLRVRHTTAPIVAFTPGSTDHGTIYIGGMRIDIEVEPTPGVFVPVLSVHSSGSANVSMSVDPVTTAIAIAIDGPSVNMSFDTHREFAGSIPGPALNGLSFVMQLLLPQIVEPLAMVTIPSPPLGSATILEVTGSNSWPGYLCAYFNVQ